jgi:nitrilase
MSFNNIVKVAVIQSTPVLFDKASTLDKCIGLIETASLQNPDLIVFPESYIPAYPRDMIFGTTIGSRSDEGRLLWEKYHSNSVTVPGDETATLAKAAKKAGAYLSVGVTEREGKSLFCTQLFFSPRGKLSGKHRKIKPTAAERIIWGEGDGSTLTSHKIGQTIIGTLICWENYMPLARMALYNKGVNIYLAPTADNRESWQSTLIHIAQEGRCFVIGCNQFVKADDYPEEISRIENINKPGEVISAGGSCIISPLGEYIAGPVWGEEEIIFADLDLGMTIRSSLDFDPTGHYNRPDIFDYSVKGQPDTIIEE